MTLLDALGTEWSERVWVPLYDVVDDRGRPVCRDCGVRAGFNQGGGRAQGGFMICDACAQLDSCRVRAHTPVVERRPSPFLPNDVEVAHCDECSWFVGEMEWADHRVRTADEVIGLAAEHARTVHVSHWGKTHEIADHDRLILAQGKRREKWWRR